MHRFVYRTCVALISALVCALVITGWNGTFADNAIPPSNRYMAERAVSAAVERIDLSNLQGREIAVETMGDGESGEIASTVVPEALVKKGFRIADNTGTDNRVTVTVDSLVVVVERTPLKGIFGRKAAVHVTIVAVDNDKRWVFRGEETISDTFPRSIVDSLDFGHDFAENKTKVDTLVSKIKPLTIAVVLTVCCWMLYSYRG